MNRSNCSASVFLTSVFMTVMTLSPVYADDTETLVGRTLPIAGPNVTIIIDSSGSMLSNVLVDGDTYMPDTTYTGPFNDASRLYYTFTAGDAIDFPDDTATAGNGWVRSAVFACNAAQIALNSTGYFTTRYAQFGDNSDGTGSWKALVAAGSSGPTSDTSPVFGEDRTTECSSDLGIHGLDDTSPATYPVNDSVPDDPATLGDEEANLYTSVDTAAERIDWDITGATYTFFSNNFLNWIHERAASGDPVVFTRLEIVQKVARNLINDLSADSIRHGSPLRVGVMRFSTNGSGGMVVHEVADVAVNAGTLIERIDAITADNNTPLAETLYEANRYYKGESVFFGSESKPIASVDGSRTGDSYNSPITSACQKNYIVLLTDGQPVGDTEADTAINDLVGTCTGSCLDELSVYLHTSDVASGIDDVQTIDTYVIGFFTDSDLLRDTATGEILYDADGTLLPAPREGYFLAEDPDQLADAFATIFGGVTADVSSFTAPTVSVNSLNRLTNRDTLYFTMFEQSRRGEPHWNGNLKAYRIGTAGTDDLAILDAAGNRALDDSGNFKPSARSIWTLVADGPDGGDVSKGGMASRLSASRKIYSNVTTSANLADLSNRVRPENTDLTKTLLGIDGATDDERTALINFAKGLNPDGSPRKVLGDPLHSEPYVATFSGADDDLMLFFGTNDGYLHAVDPTPATATEDLEQFAFIPKELLRQLPRIKENPPSTDPIGNKAYGMDGPITGWIQNDDGDGVIESGETLHIYAGMRRGGGAQSSYHALNLANRSEPKHEFEISRSRTGYAKLGQTWSPLSHGKIRVGGTARDVLFFGGGYDTNQDSNYTPDAMGNAVYIADALTGNKIWSASNSGEALNLPDMKFSIPSEIRIIDINQDGFIDRMYVGDMGGQVWRFDIDNFASDPADAITGGLLAKLGGTDAADARRFYSPPSVARFLEDGESFLTVALGSGYRAHPLDEDVNDRFYILRDDNVLGPELDDSGDPEYGDTNPALLIEDADLAVISDTMAVSGAFAGWKLILPGSGEKSLSAAITIDGRVFFSTYTPETPALSCEPVAAIGLGKLYGIDILTGLPTLYDDPDATTPVFSVDLDPAGIPPTPRLVFTEPTCTDCDTTVFNEVAILPGGDPIDPRISTSPIKTYWYQTDADGGN
ncbi:MAG: hypothetical protein HKN70_06030 [Gammaproteobacteria bacterium]|nr:hypothetical protein [Gammaproteobacteria bacterium]